MQSELIKLELIRGEQLKYMRKLMKINQCGKKKWQFTHDCQVTSTDAFTIHLLSTLHISFWFILLKKKIQLDDWRIK